MKLQKILCLKENLIELFFGSCFQFNKNLPKGSSFSLLFFGRRSKNIGLFSWFILLHDELFLICGDNCGGDGVVEELESDELPEEEDDEEESGEWTENSLAVVKVAEGLVAALGLVPPEFGDAVLKRHIILLLLV